MKFTAFVFITILYAGLLATFHEASAHSAVQASPRLDRGWSDRHELLNGRAAESGENAQVIFIGDSITQGWEGEGKDVWAKYYAPRNAVNLGIGGDRTQHVLWRLDNGNIKGLKPKVAVLMIGTNNSNGEDNTPDQIVEGVTAIVAKLREKLPGTKILLHAIFPRSENYSAQRGKLAMINQVLRRLADEENVFWMDFSHRFLDADGTIPRNLMPDYLHLSPTAYRIWAESIEPMLSAIVGGKTAAASGSNSNLSGDWIATLPGPNGDLVDVGLTVKQEAGKLSGSFSRGEDGSLPIRDAKVNGNEFSWTVVRERSSGGTMTYRMTGRLENGKIAGKAETEFEGETRKIEWTARRK
jgi:lysophospholipase L1-like esterase